MTSPIDPNDYPTFPAKTSHSKFYNTRFTEWLRNLFNTQRDYSVQTVSDYVQPVVSAPNGPEDLAPRAEFLAARHTAQGASVGNLSRIMLINPIVNDRLVVMDFLNAWTTPATRLSIGYETMPEPFIAAAGQPRDGRVTGITLAGLASDNPSNLTAIEMIELGTPNITTVELNQPFILAPGQILSVVTTEVNILLRASFGWREIPIELLEPGRTQF